MAWQTTGRWMGATGLAALPSRGGGTSCRKWPRNRSSAVSTASGLTWWYGWVSTTSPLASKVVVSEPRRPLTTNPRFASRNHRSWFVDVPTQYAMTLQCRSPERLLPIVLTGGASAEHWHRRPAGRRAGTVGQRCHSILRRDVHEPAPVVSAGKSRVRRERTPGLGDDHLRRQRGRGRDPTVPPRESGGRGKGAGPVPRPLPTGRAPSPGR
uniref:Uncharacterized protein n=1 Tax=Ixodes ricinus TaxID=34613 RepID=A0A6B0V358_IXORI